VGPDGLEPAYRLPAEGDPACGGQVPEDYNLLLFSFSAVVIVLYNPCLINNQRPPTFDLKWGFFI